MAFVAANKNLFYFFQKNNQSNTDYHEDFIAMLETGFHPVLYRMLGKKCFPVQILRFCRFCINSYL